MVKICKAKSNLSSAFKMSCNHGMLDSFLTQMESLKGTSYSEVVAKETAEGTQKKLSCHSLSKEKEMTEKLPVMPYIHRMSNGF